MDKEILEKYKKAGEIAKTVRDEGKAMVKPGVKIIDIAEKIESRTKELGGIPAWPVNISINDIAAHYSPSKDDETEIQDGDVVKLDVGVSIDGYVADTAVTIALSEEDKKLVEASEKALEEAIKLVKPGADVKDISAKIEEVIENYGFKPITNLTGHGLKQYIIHSEPRISNCKDDYSYILEEGEVIAIEPFVTRGRNYITEEDESRALIYSLIQEKPCRSREAKEIMKKMSDRHGLPFSDRWVDTSGIKLRLAINELSKRNCITSHSILKGDSKIAQSEHTILVLDEPIVITQ